MVFSSQLFLFAFLPVVLLLYYVSPARLRNWVLLSASLLFYAWGAPRFVFVLIASCAVDYSLALGIHHAAPGNAVRAKRLITLAIVLNVAVLAYFKYANFFVDDFNAVARAMGFGEARWTAVALPIGISFFTFHKISYLVDVYRRIVEPARSFGTFLLYVSFFPQLIAGPIIRYHDVAHQLVSREHTAERFLSGVWRFCLGLARKVLIANALGDIADDAFAKPMEVLHPLQAWIGLVCYALQIYFDFAGYSDMAIGLGRMFGIQFLENFNMPYIARSITEFWRRWHISLSNFMREYLYIPLGGNRVAAWRIYVNLWIVFLISGFWHGAAWNFIAWGAYHGLFLSLDRLARNTRLARAPAWVAIPTTFVILLFGWLLFRVDSLAHAAQYAAHLFTVHGTRPEIVSMMGARTVVMLILALLVCFIPALPLVDRVLAWGQERANRPGFVVARFAASVILLVLSAAALTTTNFNPFIYFRF